METAIFWLNCDSIFAPHVVKHLLGCIMFLAVAKKGNVKNLFRFSKSNRENEGNVGRLKKSREIASTHAMALRLFPEVSSIRFRACKEAASKRINHDTRKRSEVGGAKPRSLLTRRVKIARSQGKIRVICRSKGIQRSHSLMKDSSLTYPTQRS